MARKIEIILSKLKDRRWDSKKNRNTLDDSNKTDARKSPLVGMIILGGRKEECG